MGQPFPASTTSEDFPDGTVGYTYSLRVRATDSAGNVSAWSPVENVTVVNDPSSAVLPFSSPITNNTSFQVQWLGFASNTINSYKIYYRVAPSATWVEWNTYLGTVTFDTFDVTSEIPGYANETILVQFQAVATANNSPVEPLDPGGVEASIVVDPNDNMSNNTIFLPVVAKN